MAVTAQQVFEMAMALIDEVLDNGTISESETKSYSAKAPRILTMGQNELIHIGDLYKTYEISNSPVENQLGYTSNFDIVEHKNEDLIFTSPQCKGSKSYYFEVDGEATVYIEEQSGADWMVLEQIDVPNTVTSFTAYKGLISPSNDTNQVRIRFSGNYFYRTINRALFGVNFQADRIPDYRPWVKKTMPADFKSIDQIIKEYPEQQYAKDYSYKWEGKNNLYVYYYFNGNIRIVYRPIPSIITSLSQTLEIDDITATTILPYFLATHLMLDENPDLADYFNQRFMELKALAMLKPPVSEEAIIDIYGFES